MSLCIVPNLRRSKTSGTQLIHLLFSTASVLLIATISRVSAADDDNDDQPMTATCCWPLQFQSHLGRWSGTNAGGIPTVMSEEMLLYFDYPFRRWGFWIREEFVTTDYQETIYVENYREGKATLAGVNGCATFPLPPDSRMQLPCLPVEARYVETLWLGNRSIPYDVWEWTDDEFISDGDDVSAKISVSISHDNCKWVSDIAIWNAKNYNYTAYISAIDMHIGETDGKTNDPFADINRYYDCEERDEVPKDLYTYYDVFADQIYLLNRIHART